MRAPPPSSASLSRFLLHCPSLSPHHMKQRLFVNKQSSGSSTALLSGRCHQLQLCTFLTKGGERFSPSAPNIRSTKDSFKGEELSALPRADLDTWGWGAQGCQCTQTSLLSTQLRWARPAGSFWVTVVSTAPPQSPHHHPSISLSEPCGRGAG